MEFDHIVGNAKVKRVLSAYIDRGRVPTSMIFSGPDAAHTLPMALAFAQSLNCLSRGSDPGRECRNCQAIEKGMFPDVRVIYPDGQFFRKMQIDELIEAARFRPALTEKKVFILVHAHCMNDNAANAFLKTLEEPSPSNVIILITSNLSLVLPTIRSRCQVLPFSSLNRGEIQRELVKMGVNEEKARLLSFYPNRSLEEYSQDQGREIEEKRGALFALLVNLVTQVDVEDILLDLSDRSRSRESFLADFREMINVFLVFFRDLMILHVDRENQHLANFDLREKMVALIPKFPVERGLFLIQKMEWLLRDVKRNLNSRVLALEFINAFSFERRGP